MQHRRRDGRCINAIPSVVAANRERMQRAWSHHHFQDSSSPATARERASFAGNIFRTNRNRIVRKSGLQSIAFDAANTRRFSAPNMLCPTT
jgi:hypothetical protein